MKTEMVRKAAFEATPILVEGKLLLSTPYDHVIALDPVHGTKLWEYDPGLDLQREFSEVASRGVSAWVDPGVRPGGPCRLRIYLGTLDGRLIALDGETGHPCAKFGARGAIDLSRDAATPTEWTGGYQVTSAPAIYRDLVITGSSIADNWKVRRGGGSCAPSTRAPASSAGPGIRCPGPEHTRPPDRRGQRVVHAVGGSGARPGASFRPAAPAPDYYGGIRQGDNGGRTPWWPCAPRPASWCGDSRWCTTICGTTTSPRSPRCSLEGRHPGGGHQHQDGACVRAESAERPAAAAGGRAPGAAIGHPGRGELATQPFSTISLVPEKFEHRGRVGPDARGLELVRGEDPALAMKGSSPRRAFGARWSVPGNVGGVNWGGAAYDPERHLMIVNTNRLVAWVRMIPRGEYHAETQKQQDNRIYGEFGDQAPAPYGMYRAFLFSPSGAPCNAPPWGTTVAVDLVYRKEGVGDTAGHDGPGKATGSINLGGPMVTAGGLVFTSATIDPVLRAFDSETGKELWSYQLPAGGQATPMTYTVRGTQYVVIAAGGHGKLGTPQGDYVMAFALKAP